MTLFLVKIRKPEIFKNGLATLFLEQSDSTKAQINGLDKRNPPKQVRIKYL